MRPSILFILISLAIASCSDKQSSPVAPAGKTTGDLPGLLGSFEPDRTNTQEENPSESSEIEEETQVESPEQPKLFEIELLFADNVPERDRELFREAVREWERVILQGKRDVVLPYDFLNVTPAVHEGRMIDDLLVLVKTRVPPSSGVPRFGFEAFARVHYTRPSGYPALGQITYSEDARDIIARNRVDRVSDFNRNKEANSWPEHIEYMTEDEFVDQIMYVMALHEIGHLLGIGTTPEWFNLIKPSAHFDPPQPPKIYGNGQEEFDFFFAGEYGNRGFMQIHDALTKYYGEYADNYLYGGTAIPMDDEKHHWQGLSETYLDIMGSTRVIQNNGIAKRYISALTLGALTDLGYDVDRRTAIYKADWYWPDMITVGHAGKPVASPLFTCLVGM